MATKKRKSAVERRLSTMSQDEMAQRWLALRPRYVRWSALFALAATILFLYNRMVQLQQGTVNIVNVAFQICCIFLVLFATMTAMSFIYGRPSKKPSAT